MNHPCVKNGIGVLAAMLAAAVATGAVWAQQAGAPRELLRLEWQVREGKAGPPTLTGYVYNQHVFRASNIRLLVEDLDTSGQRIHRTVAYVSGDVAPDGRAPFEVSVATSTGSHRVVLLWLDWFLEAP